MSAPNSLLPDLTLWESIRVCATTKLESLVKTIEAEIARDETLADLRRTGSGRIAIEFRARKWMLRAYACCLDCWQNGQQKEETAEFRTAVYFYCLSPFFSTKILRLLRLAAGLSQETISQLEGDRKAYFSTSESVALHNASEVYTKLTTSWSQDLPPIGRSALSENSNPVRVVSKAPRPPSVVGGMGVTIPKPKPVELPASFPSDFPRLIALKARVILSDVVREFPDRSKLEELCRKLVFRYADLLCIGVSSGVLQAHSAPDALSTIVHAVLVTNCERDSERFEIERKVINSDEWHAMLKRLLECEERAEAQKDKSPDSAKIANPTRQRIDAFIEKMRDSRHQITRTEIWRVAGYENATEFERFQREDPRTTSGSRAKFDRVLNLSPEEFLRRIQALDPK